MEESSSSDTIQVLEGEKFRIITEDELKERIAAGLDMSNWVSSMNEFFGKEFTFDYTPMRRWNAGYNRIFTLTSDNGYGYDYSIDKNFIVLFREQPEVKELNFSLLCDDDEVLRKHMIQSVDKTRLWKLFTLGCDGHRADRKIVDKYLDEWSMAKLPFYKLFGNKLQLEKEIEVQATTEEVALSVDQILLQFPKYAPLVNWFCPDEYRNNEIDLYNYNQHAEQINKYFPSIANHGKLTRFLNGVLGDEEFNQAISAVLGNTTVKTVISLSIDPYDYMTMSLNNQGWQSCHRFGGCYSTGVLSYLLDSTSIVSYRYSGSEQEYDINNYKWKGNSKIWRQMIYIDTNSSAFIASRQYPSYTELVDKEVRNMLEELISSYLGFDNTWIIKSNVHPGYQENSALQYHDVTSGHDHLLLTPKQYKGKTEFIVGNEVAYCLVCGKEITGGGDDYICGWCS